MAENFAVAQLDEIEPVACPCGRSRRALAGVAGAPASVHLVDIAEQTAPHYHRRTTEIYVVLEGEGEVELDGRRVPVRPMSVVMIRPGCRHRAIGRLRILNCVVPPFDPEDEFTDP